MSLELVSVTFKTGWRGYGVGDVAGFKPYKAEQLVKQGIAGYSEKRKSGRKKLNDEVDKRKKSEVKDAAVEK